MKVKKNSVIEEALMEFEAGKVFYYRTTENYSELQDNLAKLKADPKDKQAKYKATLNTKLVVNGLSIFDKELTISHDRSYNFAKDVKNNEIIDIHIEWEPFD